MISNFEFTVILKTDDKDFTEGLTFVKDAFTRHKAVISEESDLGVKTLAYVIKKHETGHYVYFELSLDGEEVNAISKELNLSPLVLKFMFIKKEAR